MPWLAAAGLAALHSTSAAAFEPRINYMLNCMGCHTPDGSGEPGRVPSIKTTLAPFARLAAGRRYIVEVPGVAQSRLSDADLATLLNWIMRNLAEGVPPAPAPFTAAEVERYRRTPLMEVSAARARLIEQIRRTPGIRRIPGSAYHPAKAGG
jgi:mono/diheme cytochrome c family protein